MNVPLHTIEICAGVGMLGEGLRAGLARMGIDTRVCCYLEREAYPAAVLAARMQDGSMDAAPGQASPPPSTRRLNPAFGEWMMGWPVGWSIAEPSASSASETASWRFALQQQLSCLFNE